ncbi:MAG: hypothetical protein OXI97_05505 [Acidimicrobiaceae bacterium]|nr:hypothetical protein [Acidimicrobiaceae bacterium]
MNFSKAIAVYLKLVGAAVVINLCAYPFYREHQPENFDSWSVLNWFMASALLLTLVTTWLRRSAAGTHDRNARAMFIFAAAVTIPFVPNWFADVVDGSDNLIMWYLIDSAMPILLWMEGHRLWKSGATR